MSKFFQRGIILFVAGLLTISIISYYGYYLLDCKHRTEHIESIKKQLQTKTHLVESAIIQKFITVELIHTVLTESCLKELTSNSHAFVDTDNLLKTIADKYPDHSYFICFDKDGKQIYSRFLNTDRKDDLSKISLKLFDFLKNNTTNNISILFPPLFTGTNQQFYCFASPLILNSNLAGYAILFADLGAIFNNELDIFHPGMNGNFGLLDKDGLVLYHTQKDLVGNPFNSKKLKCYESDSVMKNILTNDSGTIFDQENSNSNRIKMWKSINFKSQKIIALFCVNEESFHYFSKHYRIAAISSTILIYFMFTALVILILLRKARKAIFDKVKTQEEFFNGYEIGIIHLKETIMGVNKKALTILGYSADDMLGKQLTDFFPPFQPDGSNSVDQFERIIRELSVSSSVKRWKILKRNDDLIDVELNLKKIILPDETLIICIIRDLTEVIKAELSLKNSESKYLLLAENISDIIFLTDLELKLTYISISVAKLLGHIPEDLIGKSLKQFIEEKSYQELENKMRLRINLEQTQKTIYTSRSEVEVLDSQGNKQWVEVVSNPYRDDNSNIIGFVGIARDISERKESQQLLYEEKEQLDVILRSIKDAVIATDETGKIILMNRIAEELTGYSSQSALGKPLETILSIKSITNKNPYTNVVDKILTNSDELFDFYRSVLALKDGTEIIIHISASTLKDKKGKIIGVVIVFRDITESNKLELELQRAQRIESISLLAGGIAHDFNNILVAILGNISLVKFNTSKQENNYMLLEEAEKASLKAKDLTQQLLSFAKGGEPVKESTDIFSVVKDIASSLIKEKKFVVSFTTSEELPFVDIDQIQIKQVFQNILLNAKEAMPDGGKIEICLRSVNLNEKEIPGLKSGNYVMISISDQGIGIKEDSLTRVFDPYYTTKPKGSGLGLFISFSIVKKHNGYINLVSHQGQGTTAQIYLPSTSLIIQEQISEEIIKGKGRILVMDDEELVCTVVKKMLTSLEYESTIVNDGNEALKTFANSIEYGKKFDAVILDLTIHGGMGGLETLEKMLFLDENVKAIVSSGFSNDEVVSNFKKYGFKGVIRKPYKVSELSEVLNNLLSND
ncbi:MAG: PAS domain S-box protein [Candidatus Cloacimonetes bacterium]|nr:PAS domain S-box protein [Candidatus Cloacimonadota bacterium]